MKHSQGKFDGPGGLSVYYQYWQPLETPTGVIMIAHGAAEHGGRYRRFAEYFVKHGFAVAALDHPGHGQSEGGRCQIRCFADYLSCLRQFHLLVANDFPGAPVWLLGHSMGGLIATAYLLQYQAELAGCILSGAAIKTDMEPGWLQNQIFRLLSAVLPGVGVLQLDAAGVSRNPQEVEIYVNDPLVYQGKLPARMVKVLFEGMHQVQANAAAITVPMLIMHGGADAMTSPEGSRYLEAHVSSKDKTLSIYPGLYHEIFNEPERDEIFAEVLAWCQQRQQRP